MSHIWSASVSSPSSILHGLVEYSSGTLIKLFIIGRAASNSLLITLPKTSHLKILLSVAYMLAKLLTT